MCLTEQRIIPSVLPQVAEPTSPVQQKKKRQGKIALSHHTPKSTGHILSLSHICSFLQIHSAPAETRSHHQSSHMDGAHRKVWAAVKYLERKDLVGNCIQAQVSTALHIKYPESICKYIDTVKNYTARSGQTDTEVIGISSSSENIKKYLYKCMAV